MIGDDVLLDSFCPRDPKQFIFISARLGSESCVGIVKLSCVLGHC